MDYREGRLWELLDEICSIMVQADCTPQQASTLVSFARDLAMANGPNPQVMCLLAQVMARLAGQLAAQYCASGGPAGDVQPLCDSLVGLAQAVQQLNGGMAAEAKQPDHPTEKEKAPLPKQGR